MSRADAPPPFPSLSRLGAGLAIDNATQWETIVRQFGQALLILIVLDGAGFFPLPSWVRAAEALPPPRWQLPTHVWGVRRIASCLRRAARRQQRASARARRSVWTQSSCSFAYSPPACRAQIERQLDFMSVHATMFHGKPTSMWQRIKTHMAFVRGVEA